MNTVPECDLKWNVWLQDFDGLGMIAKDRQAEIRQDKNAVSYQCPPRVSRTLHFAWRRALAVAVANVMMNWFG